MTDSENTISIYRKHWKSSRCFIGGRSLVWLGGDKIILDAGGGGGRGGGKGAYTRVARRLNFVVKPRIKRFKYT